MLLIPARGRSSGYAVTPSNNIVTAVGDSITLASAAGTGGKAPGVAGYSKYQAQTVTTAGVGGYLTWACILPKTGDTFSDGPMLWGGVHATGGANTATILADHIDGTDSPLNDSPKAGTCLVLVGANDTGEGTNQSGGEVNQATIATWETNVRDICQTLINNDILPVLCTVTPHTTADNRVAIAAMNVIILDIAADLNIPYADTAAAVSSGGEWIASYNDDANHPSNLGGVAMGQAIRDVVEPLMPASRPTLVTTATETDAIYQWLNGPFQRESGTTGVPRGGAPAVEDLNPWTWAPNNATPTLGARSGYNGQAWRINKLTHASDTTAISAGGAGVPPQYADGDNFAFGFVAEIASWEASTGFNFEAYKSSDPTVKMARLVLKTDTTYTTAVKPFVWYQTNTIPASFSSNCRISFAWGQGGTKVIDAYLGQLSVVKPV
jgi:lysophospholipase L1-like esterase